MLLYVIIIVLASKRVVIEQQYDTKHTSKANKAKLKNLFWTIMELYSPFTD